MTKEELTTLHALYSLADEGRSATSRLVADRTGASLRDVAQQVPRLARLGLVVVVGHGAVGHGLRLTFPGLAVAARVGAGRVASGSRSHEVGTSLAA